MSESLLRREYAYYSWNHQFSEVIEKALEDDYVNNKLMYTQDTLKQIELMLLILPEANAEQILNFIKATHSLLI